jgi:hypothetical protein
VLISMLAAIAAVGLGLGRFAWYAAAFIAFGVGVGAADLPPEAAMLAGGLVAVVSGAALLARFIQRTGAM